MGGMKSAGLPDAGIGGDVGVPGEGFSAPLPAPQSDFLSGLSSGGLKLSNPVGRGAVNNPADVFQVESALSNADLLSRPPGRTFGDDTFGAIKTAQGKLNADSRLDLAQSPLKVDGLINPDGPTQTATRSLATDVLTKRTLTGPKPRTPLPGVPPVKTLLNKPAPLAAPSDPRRETLKQATKRFTKNKPPLTPAPKAPPKAPALSGDDFSELQRLAGALRTSNKPGPVAKDIADAFRGNPANTAKEFKVVRDSLAKSGTAEQVNNLTQGVRAELSPQERKQFDDLIGEVGEDRLIGGEGNDRPGNSGLKMTPPRKPIPPGKDLPDGGFESPIDQKFRDKIHKRESQARNYEEISPDGKALGRYQIRKEALVDAGLMDKQGHWTGKYGINSSDNFLSNPQVQERALVDVLTEKHKQLRKLGSIDTVGHTFTGLIGKPITITESGLLAAAHRQGAEKVRQYLGHMRNHNWQSNFNGIKPKEAAKFKAIEKRLREFQNTPVRRK